MHVQTVAWERAEEEIWRDSNEVRNRDLSE